MKAMPNPNTRVLPAPFQKFCLVAAIAASVLGARGQCITPLILWEANNNLPTQFSDPKVNGEDPDGDGIPNILEWAFNLSPNVAGRPVVTAGTGTNGLPLITCFPGNSTNIFTVEYIRNNDAPVCGVTYRVETSTSLTGPWILAANGEIGLPIPSGNYQHVITGVQPLLPIGTQQFCRVAVEVKPVYCPATIYEIKEGILPVASTVELANALITGVTTNGFFLQVKEIDPTYNGPFYSGIFVSTGTNSPWLANLAAGERVTVDGAVDSVGPRLVLDQIGGVTLLNTFIEAAPAPISTSASGILYGGVYSAALDATIVQLSSETVSATDVGQFLISDGSNPTVVDESLYIVVPPPFIGETFGSVTGIYSVHNTVPLLSPRFSGDLAP
jgi:hypothetical protein